MQSTSQLWRDLLASGAALQARAVIGGAVYTEISPPVIHRALMQERLSVGNVVSASLSMAVRGAGSISRSAAVVIEARLSDGVTASEWLPQGTFYISRRARDPVTGLLALECYDALLKANAIWTPSAGEWPRTMAAVTAELAALLGVDLDSRTVIPTGAAYAMSQPAEGSTIRDALGTVAQAAGGNWIITPRNRLRLVRLGEAGDRVDVAGAVGGIDVGPACTVTGVRSTVDGVVTLAGDDTGIVVDVTVAPMIAAELAEELVGLFYQPFTLGGAIYDPAAELGDGVRAGAGGEVASVICSEQAVLGPAFRGDIAAPDPGELTDEYPYIGRTERTLALAKAAAARAAGAAVDALDQQEIFDRLTDNGAAQGLVLYDGQLYINASYINAGVLNVGLINFRDYSPPYQVPNEYDPDSLFSGQAIQNGWIVNRDGSSDIGIIGCSDAVPLRGKTLIITLTSRNHITALGGYYDYIGEDGQIWSETLPETEPPAYGREDAEGNLDGATDNGEYEQYSTKYHVGENEVGFYLTVRCSGVKSISVSESYSNNFGLRYGNNIGLNYKGLQVGKFVVDRSGNVTFNGDAIFNGDVSFANPGAARNALAITPANIGAPTTGGTGATGTWGINVTGSAGSVAWGNVSGKPNVATTDTAQTFTGTKSWGTSGAGGQLNGAATNGGINSIKIGDDVWLGDCNAGGIMGMKSTGSNCGFYMYNSSGTNIGQLYFNGTNLVCDKTIQASITGNAANVTGTVAVGHGGTGATNAAGARGNLGIHAGTAIINFSDGTGYASFGTFGLSARPAVFVATASNKDAFMRYDFDNSSSQIRLGCITVSGGNLAGVSGSVRFSWIAIP